MEDFIDYLHEVSQKQKQSSYKDEEYSFNEQASSFASSATSLPSSAIFDARFSLLTREV